MPAIGTLRDPFRLSRELSGRLPEIMRLAGSVEGFLTAKEMEFLALLGACPTAEGEVLEIGSFKGKSTVILARAAALVGDWGIVAVDPLCPSGSFTMVDCPWEDEFCANLDRCGVAGLVEFHKAFSTELAKTWDRPLRLLWVDGDHSYEGAKTDLDIFSPHLSPGAIVAFHDMLKPLPGPLLAFANDVLSSRLFGAAGVCGSIGWAQYSGDPAAARRHSRARHRLRHRLRRLARYAEHGRGGGVWKTMWNLNRYAVPHGRVDPAMWLREVDLPR
jgi:hypothetical protein